MWIIILIGFSNTHNVLSQSNFELESKQWPIKTAQNVTWSHKKNTNTVQGYNKKCLIQMIAVTLKQALLKKKFVETKNIVYFHIMLIKYSTLFTFNKQNINVWTYCSLKVFQWFKSLPFQYKYTKCSLSLPFWERDQIPQNGAIFCVVLHKTGTKSNFNKYHL